MAEFPAESPRAYEAMLTLCLHCRRSSSRSFIVDMVPGSAADVQRMRETSSQPRMQIGDRVLCVDGVALEGRGLDEVIQVSHPSCIQHRLFVPGRLLRRPPRRTSLYVAMCPARSVKADSSH